MKRFFKEISKSAYRRGALKVASIGKCSTSSETDRLNLNLLRFIHVGKCGGTSILKSLYNANLAIEQYHLSRQPIFSEFQYILWIRDPIKRFISAFNHSKLILNWNHDSLSPQTLTLDNCPAPQRINNRKLLGYTFTPEYDYLLSKFESANHLAESLSSTNITLRQEAFKLMRHPSEHIFKGLGWYLDNGSFVEHLHEKIKFVGCVEMIDQDFRRLISLLLPDNNQEYGLTHFRNNLNYPSKNLSQLAQKNIYSFYKNTDYNALEILLQKKLINQDLYDMYLGNALHS